MMGWVCTKCETYNTTGDANCEVCGLPIGIADGPSSVRPSATDGPRVESKVSSEFALPWGRWVIGLVALWLAWVLLHRPTSNPVANAPTNRPIANITNKASKTLPAANAPGENGTDTNIPVANAPVPKSLARIGTKGINGLFWVRSNSPNATFYYRFGGNRNWRYTDCSPETQVSIAPGFYEVKVEGVGGRLLFASRQVEVLTGQTTRIIAPPQ